MDYGSGIASAGRAIGGALTQRKKDQKTAAADAETAARQKAEYQVRLRELQATYERKLQEARAEYQREVTALRMAQQQATAMNDPMGPEPSAPGPGLEAGLEMGAPAAPGGMVPPSAPTGLEVAY